MKTYGIIGFPLTASFSKQFFTEKIGKEGIPDAVYHSYPLSTINEFPGLLKSDFDLRGLSVTIPYKEQVLQFITHQSNEVKQIGATNCIKIRGSVLTAYNTDIIGFEESFIKNLKPTHTKALVLGTGGASKAVQFVLRKLEIDFLVVSRDGQNIKGFVQYADITNSILEEHSIIINTTPLGMTPDENTCPDVPYNLLTKEHYLFDLVYKPAKTLFLQKGEERGCLIKNGYEMLIIQAEANWKIWNED